MTSSSSRWDSLRIINVGDIHLGHPDTRTTTVIGNLRREFRSDVLAETDLMLINGDTFDHLLNFSDPQTRDIVAWIDTLLTDCATNGVIVVVLKGTPSHDWDQSKWFEEVQESRQIPVELHYVDRLDILRIEKYDLNMLCVPDEWRSTPEETWLEVQDLLRLHGLTQVDVALMHGYFPPQLPEKLSHGAHDIDNYSSIVKYYIAIGHIHQHWRHGKIVAPSSFDRLRHLEEDPKGYVLTTIFNGRYDDTLFEFKENKGAQIYLTVDVRGKEEADVYDIVTKAVSGLKRGSHVRIMTERGSTIRSTLSHWRETYPDLVWIHTNKDPKGTEVNTGQLVVGVSNGDLVKSVSITPANIMDLMSKRLESMGVSNIEDTLKVLGELTAEVDK